MTNLEEVRARFARDQGLPFADALTECSILDVLNEHGVPFRDRLFNPVTTIWGFLGQVLSEDHSCRDTVSRIIAHRAASGLEPCSPNTASYCNARARIPTAVLRNLARVTVLLSLATGACHDLAIAPYAGKGTGETPLLRQMYGSLSPGDVVLADALFDNYFLACELRQLGIERVARVQAERVGSWTVQSRPDGDIIVWQRPNKPRGMTGEQYRRYPKCLTMRQVSVDARGKDNRAEQFKVVTTILDASIDGGQIGGLYERRWDGEVDIRSIKSTMKMDILRCKTPEMVRKEIWVYLLAYNLLRTVMAVAAHQSNVEPRAISFKGAKQALTAFAPKLEAARPEQRAALVDAMLEVVAYHRVGNRPGRWEPRARKRRPKPSKRLNQPRHVAKLARNRAKWY